MISYNEANSIIEKDLRKLKVETEEIDLISCTNRILAEDIYSDIDFPPFTNSAMDGYAVRFNPGIKKWKISGEISAGNYKEYEIGDGLTVSIMTGARLPEKADTVIPVEDVTLENDTIIINKDSVYRKGFNVRKAGSDLLKGNIAVEKDTLLKPKNIAVAASCGKSRLKVYRKIKIGVLATGDELIDITETPSNDKIRSSNVYALLAAIEDMGQSGFNLGTTKDNKEEITAGLKSFLVGDFDILITTGGVSVGRYDIVKSEMEKLGIKLHFWKVNIKPGKPVVFGTHNDGHRTRFVFGLPGNPVSCLVSFIIFIKKNIFKLYGIPDQEFFSAELTENISKTDGKLHFMMGLYTRDNSGNNAVKRIGSQSSGNLTGMGRANCLIIFDEEKREMKSGEKIICIPI